MTIAALVWITSTLLFLGTLLLKTAPATARQYYLQHRPRYFVILIIPALVFVFSAQLAQQLSPRQELLYDVLTYAGIFVFCIFLLRGLLAKTRQKFLWGGAILFSIYIAVVTGFGSALKKIDQGPNKEELAALPYVAFTSSENGKSGVSVHDRDRVSTGLNLYAPNHLAQAFLMDMDGRILHQWKNPKGREVWAHVEMNQKGELFAINKDYRLTKLDWNSNVLWRTNGRFHHDVRFATNGDVYALSRKDEIVLHYGLPVPILNDYVVILAANGEIKKQYGLYDFLKRYISLRRAFSVYRKMLQPKRLLGLWKRIFTRSRFLFVQTSPFDLFHTNTVEFVGPGHGFFREGDLLISSRNISLVAVLKLDERKVIWETDQFTMQHQPGFLQNKNILVFDNGLPSTGSRVAEVDPRSKHIVWEYRAPDFYAYNRGGSQRLPNGNTLITESPDGRAFEVTREGKIVWEFFTPQVSPKKRSVIYRLQRFSNFSMPSQAAM